MTEDEEAESPELSVWEARRKRLQKEAIREVMLEYGFTTTDPTAVQQDLAWLRRRRLLEESMTAKIVGGLLTLLITPGVVAAIVAAYFQGQR